MGSKDQIYQIDSRNMDEVDSESVHLVVTSPPYNAGIEYDGHDDEMPWYDYATMLHDVFSECFRTLVVGGRMCINVANIGRNPYMPLTAVMHQVMTEVGFLARGQIIWDKGPSAGRSTAWGSWCSASNPVMRDVHEYICVFCKGDFSRPPGESSISRDEFLEYTKSIWSFKTESAKRVGHPAPFPIELPSRCIKLYSYIGDTVLDPFLGSGTTAQAAYNLNRHYVGYEVSEKYVEIARRRMAQKKLF